MPSNRNFAIEHDVVMDLDADRADRLSGRIALRNLAAHM
jgi:hypothetical protein